MDGTFQKNWLQETYGVVVLTIDCDLSKPDAAETIYNYCSQKELQLHMNTPVLLCRFFGARMLEKQNGYILNTSSISAVMPYPTISLYGPTKSFLRAFTRALRSELKGSGVGVSCLIPGATATALYDTDQLNLTLLVRLGIMKRPAYVARAGVRALFSGRAERVPGVINKLILLIVPLIPHALVGYIYKRSVKRKS